MKATNAYAAKRAVIDRLKSRAATTGHPLEGVQVADAWPPNIGERCIYGGGARFTQAEGAAEPGEVRRETVTTGLYVRVLLAGDVRSVEAVAESYADIVAAELAEDPDLAPGLTFTQIVGGSADFYPTDDGVEAVLAMSVEIDSWLD